MARTSGAANACPIRATTRPSRVRWRPSRPCARRSSEASTPEIYTALAPQLAPLGVELIEQPLPAGADAPLAGLARPVPVCADESCHDTASLAHIAGKYDAVNIKLDKTGGLTEALRL